jgi:predicted MFS family arabinose efflux permease
VTAAAWRTARLSLGSACALGLGRFAYGLILPAMTDDLNWTLAEAATLTTANGLGYLAGALATPAVERKLGAPTTFRLGMAVCAAALGATAIGTDHAALLVTRAITGFAGALVFIVGAVLTPGVGYFAGAGLGIAFSGALLPPLLDQHPSRWPLAWIATAIAATLATAVTWTAARAAQAARPARAARTAHAARPARAPRPTPPAGPQPVPLWPVAAAYLLFAAGYLAYLTFLSTYLEIRAAPTWQVALTWTLLGAAVVATPLLWQRSIARRPDGRTLAGLLTILSAAALLPLVRPDPPAIAASALAYGATFMAVPAAVTALIRGAVPPERITGTLARLTVIFALGQTAGPWLAGLVADHTTPAATLGWTVVLCGLAATVAITATARISRHRLSSDVGEGLADGETGGAGRRGFGGERGAEDDEHKPDTDGGDRDPVRQGCGEEQVAEPGAEDRGERECRDGRYQAAGERQEDAFGDDDPAYGPGPRSDGVHDTELPGAVEDVGAHCRGQADDPDDAKGQGDPQQDQDDGTQVARCDGLAT